MSATRPEAKDANTWTFRGYQLGSANFATAMVHFYRGEVSRTNTWRTRLDATTNWAVITTAAALTFAFSSAHNPHFVLLLVLLLVLTFLFIEARRYRYYALWYYRVHLMETDFFAAMLASPFRPSADWADQLAESLLDPAFPITHWEAIGLRFRRNYSWLISLLLISWVVKLAFHPTPMADWSDLVERATIVSIPAGWVIGVVTGVYGLLVAMALVSSLRRYAEARSSRDVLSGKQLRKMRSFVQRRAKRRENLALIITVCGESISQQLMTELGRGVTALQGTGMYTGTERDVLLCAVTDVQVSRLKAIVQQGDPNAFVVVNSAQEVRGYGFDPFAPPS
jgi:uncharacterized membrane protein